MVVPYKRLIICCDGTGQSSTIGTAQTAQTKVSTNVFRLVDSLKKSFFIPDYDENGQPTGTSTEIPQMVQYQVGVGADGHNSLASGVAKAFGDGLDNKVQEAYKFLANNYEGDSDEIFLFGFSRGAFTVRAIASFICNAGLLQKDSLSNLDTIYKKYKERRDTKAKREEFEAYMTKNQSVFKLRKGVVIKVMGVWDTVGSLGVPDNLVRSGLAYIGVHLHLNESLEYHDTSLPTPLRNDTGDDTGDNTGKDTDWRVVVVNAYQALALDERRMSFTPTLIRLPLMADDDKVFNNDTGFYQTWFPGAHTDVGGGYERAYRDLSDISFAWMVDLLNGHLEFRDDLPGLLKETTVDSDRKAGVEKPKEKVPWGLSKIHDEMENPLFHAGGARNRTPGQYHRGEKDENGRAFDTNEYMHQSVRLRWQDDPSWRPKSLEGFTPHPPPDPREEGMYAYLWRWVKTVNGSKIVIYEDPGMGRVQMSMLTEKEKKFFEIPDDSEVPE